MFKKGLVLSVLLGIVVCLSLPAYVGCNTGKPPVNPDPVDTTVVDTTVVDTVKKDTIKL